jgi:hypothetical protein
MVSDDYVDHASTHRDRDCAPKMTLRRRLRKKMSCLLKRLPAPFGIVGLRLGLLVTRADAKPGVLPGYGGRLRLGRVGFHPASTWFVRPVEKLLAYIRGELGDTGPRPPAGTVSIAGYPSKRCATASNQLALRGAWWLASTRLEPSNPRKALFSSDANRVDVNHQFWRMDCSGARHRPGDPNDLR